MKQRQHFTQARNLARVLGCASLLGMGAAHADYTVPAGEVALLDGATLNLVCEHLIVQGQLTVRDSTIENIASLHIASGATFTLINSTLDVAQSTISNSGSFTGARFTATASCGDSNLVKPPPTPVPANGPLGLALLGLLIAAAQPVRRWRAQRQARQPAAH